MLTTLVKFIGPILLLAFSLLSLSPSSLAQTRYEIAPSLTVGGSIRGRYEFKDNFAFGASVPANSDNFFISQLRLNLLWTFTDFGSLFIEGQDARVFEDDSVNEKAVPNVFQDRFDLHQAYLDLRLPSSNLNLKVGRQKLQYGDQRLIGPLEWVNTARVFDAVKITFNLSEFSKFDVFSARQVPVDPIRFNDWSRTVNRHANSSLYGLYYSGSELGLDLDSDVYYLLRHEDDLNDEVHTFGIRLLKKLEDLSIGGEFSAQGGRFNSLSHRAWAATTHLNYKVDSESSSSATISYSYASGDDNPLDSKHKTFDNLFPTNHVFYGYMDLFALQNIHNIELSISSKALWNIPIRLAWNNFWLAEQNSDSWYNAGLGVIRTPDQSTSSSNYNSYVGNELDLTVSHDFWNKRLSLLIGYSHFFTGKYVKQTGPSKDADYFYFQTKLSI